jgi:hypothetical protein
MIFLIITNLVLLIFLIKFYRDNKNNKALLLSKTALLENEASKLKILTNEKEVIELELGFVKGIYRSKLVKMAMESEKIAKKTAEV